MVQQSAWQMRVSRSNPTQHVLLSELCVFMNLIAFTQPTDRRDRRAEYLRHRCCLLLGRLKTDFADSWLKVLLSQEPCLGEQCEPI